VHLSEQKKITVAFRDAANCVAKSPHKKASETDYLTLRYLPEA